MTEHHYTKAVYLESWDYHIKQLSRIAPSNCDDSKRVARIAKELTAIVCREADAMFPRPESCSYLDTFCK